jgi:PAS domain S-box-containing protein
MAIPAMMAFFILRRKQKPNINWIAWLFVAFIFGCGTTHLMGTVVFYWPVYWLDGLVKALTAAVSFFTVLALGKLMPYLLEMKRPEEVEEEARLLQFILQESHQGIIAVRKDGTFLYFNDKAKELLGTDAEFPMRDWSSRYMVFRLDGTPCPNDELPLVRALRGEEVKGDVELIIKAEGKEPKRIVVTASTMIYHGQQIGMVVMRDVSQRWEAIKALHESEQRFSVMVEGVQDYAIYFLDLQGRIASWNIGAERIHGYRSDEVIGQSLSLFLSKENKDHAAFLLNKAEKEGRVQDFGWRVKKDGTNFWVNSIITAVHDDKGQQRGFLKITRDLTKEHEQQETIDRINKELEQFAYVASHDLKAPLRGISNLALWIKEDIAGKVTPEGERYFALLQERIGRMNDLIDGILQYSRVGRVYTKTEKINLKEVLAEILAGLDKKNFTIEVGDIPQIVGNRTAVLQLFQNLISNAIRHHTRDNGHVRIGAVDMGKKWEFWVKDDGPGIDRRYQHKLFGMFQTLSTTGGTGVGLALCKKIVVVEDDEIDRMNIERAIAKLGLSNPLFFASDGVEAPGNHTRR